MDYESLLELTLDAIDNTFDTVTGYLHSHRLA
jgi:hypothetical protein